MSDTMRSYATPAQLMKLGVLGYRLQYDTANLSRICWGKEPQSLTPDEAYDLIVQLEEELNERGESLDGA
jgi:hypothetical protein